MVFHLLMHATQHQQSFSWLHIQHQHLEVALLRAIECRGLPWQNYLASKEWKLGDR